MYELYDEHGYVANVASYFNLESHSLADFLLLILDLFLLTLSTMKRCVPKAYIPKALYDIK